MAGDVASFDGVSVTLKVVHVGMERAVVAADFYYCLRFGGLGFPHAVHLTLANRAGNMNFSGMVPEPDFPDSLDLRGAALVLYPAQPRWLSLGQRQAFFRTPQGRFPSSLNIVCRERKLRKVADLVTQCGGSVVEDPGLEARWVGRTINRIRAVVLAALLAVLLPLLLIVLTVESLG